MFPSVSPMSDEFTDQELLPSVSPLSDEFTDQKSLPGVSPLSDEFTKPVMRFAGGSDQWPFESFFLGIRAFKKRFPNTYVSC